MCLEITGKKLNSCGDDIPVQGVAVSFRLAIWHEVFTFVAVLFFL
jgi:hypothetical protein